MSDITRTVQQQVATLRAAADLIERRGWCQGAFQKSDGRVCVIGGIATVIGMDAVLGMISTGSVMRYVGVQDLSIWNDRPERTQSQVVAALRRCAIALEADERMPEARMTHSEQVLSDPDEPLSEKWLEKFSAASSGK